MDHVTQIDFHDEDANCPAFVIVRATDNIVGLTLSLVSQGDFAVYFTPEVARKLASTLSAAAELTA